VGGFLPVPPGRAPEVATRGLPTNRVGYVGNFFQITWGPKIQLTQKPNVFLRPNFRWDYFNGVAANPGGLLPYGDGNKRYQGILATDLLILF